MMMAREHALYCNFRHLSFPASVVNVGCHVRSVNVCTMLWALFFDSSSLVMTHPD